MISWLTDKLLGEKVANSETRHRPAWMPHQFDYRALGERIAVLSLPPYKPPYRRHGKYKAWICLGPDNVIRLNAIIEIDLDDRRLEVDIYR